MTCPLKYLTMDKRNYQKEMEQIIAAEQHAGHVPTLLLHSCCAPCSSAVLERLTPYFDLTVFYYNPNISPQDEYRKRISELRRLIGEMPKVHSIRLIEGNYDPARFYAAAEGLEDCPEGGERCMRCFRLRLEEAAGVCRDMDLDYFTTTLTISPLKNAQALNEIGEDAAHRFGVRFLPSDFKKKDGYRRSIALSREYGLYRQNFCGCVFSREQANLRKSRAGAR